MSGEHNNRNKVRLHEQFPKKEMWLYIGVIFLSAVIGLVTEGLDMSVENGTAVAAVIIFTSLLLGSMGVFAFTLIQYVLIKFPTQWIARDEEVYKYDILAALFYSNAIGMVLSTVANQLDQGENVLLAAVNTVIITVLFLYFYFNGTDKPAHVKRAIIIVQLLWLTLSLGLSLVAYQYL